MNKPIVYLVDPDHTALDEMDALLAALDVKIEKFSSAECFLHEKRPCESGCLVANIALPGLSGLALIEELKERDIHLPAVLIDNFGDVGRAVKAMRAGVADYIEKPYADRMLLKVVSDLIHTTADSDPAGSSAKP